jgi:elongation factor P
MATLSYNEITPKKVIKFNGEPYEVIASNVARKQQRKPQNQTKLKHLLTGRVIENAFHASDKAEEADIEVKPIVYLYTNKGESWFNLKDDAKNRFSLPEERVADKVKWLTDNTEIEALFFEDEVLTIRIPIKVELEVVEAPPAVRGNTAQGGSKLVVFKSGASATVPLFINEGDILRINTDTGEYVERVDKA